MNLSITIDDKQVLDIVTQALRLPGYPAEAPAAPAKREWIPASQPPKTDKRVVVKTKDGAVYFETPRDGKLMKNVAYWYPLPDDENGKEATDGEKK